MSYTRGQWVHLLIFLLLDAYNLYLCARLVKSRIVQPAKQQWQGGEGSIDGSMKIIISPLRLVLPQLTLCGSASSLPRHDAVCGALLSWKHSQVRLQQPPNHTFLCTALRSCSSGGWSDSMLLGHKYDTMVERPPSLSLQPEREKLGAGIRTSCCISQ